MHQKCKERHHTDQLGRQALGNVIKCMAKNHLFFIPVLTPPPPPPPPPRIVFKSRLGAHEVLNDCRMTVDGTDFRIPQKGAATKGNAFARGSRPRFVKISNGPNTNSECSNLLN